MSIKRLIFRIRCFFLRRFAAKSYYINGTDTLPPPLEEEIEEHLLEHIELQESRDKLIEHNLRLVVYIAKRFENTGVGIEELVSIGTVGLIKAISTFNLAFTKGNNLYVANGQGEVAQVTDEPEGVLCGQSVHRDEFGIDGGIFWSPKGNLLAFYRMDQSMVTDYPQVNTSTSFQHTA